MPKTLKDLLAAYPSSVRPQRALLPVHLLHRRVRLTLLPHHFRNLIIVPLAPTASSASSSPPTASSSATTASSTAPSSAASSSVTSQSSSGSASSTVSSASAPTKPLVRIPSNCDILALMTLCRLLLPCQFTPRPRTLTPTLTAILP